MERYVITGQFHNGKFLVPIDHDNLEDAIESFDYYRYMYSGHINHLVLKRWRGDAQKVLACYPADYLSESA